ncbi:MAG TPA: alpha/beta hydrolase [Methylomusa anaerophila]|uniref:Dihydrolipoyllysine-residue acetyltransferase component of acetoin cleaving system n=1 Tax=Methylomusa anaerophila TaxID=1930071 RepID=A0A348AGE3_9FIRM|nr:alpha/beta hydrolase [Methylomusa anaerophila]BBB90141.1 dihydrolipoyllysine-residue acetyltransferase component of acetoin cleaving system [Methylomusa anaerophila]HML88135.1 alpha/beta hydrolase [Methylomusa anaerophila]
MYNKINGIHYEFIENSASKENLVFVHGSGCNRMFLRPLAKKLKDFNCYLIDLPDHGQSENRHCTKVEDYIAAVAEFVTQLDNVRLIGHSLGGTICLGVAAKRVPSVKMNVIISSGAKFYKFDRKIHNMVREKKVNWLYLIQCCGSLTNIDVWADLLTFEPAEVILKDFEIDIKLDIENVMSHITIPTLIMVGSDDILTLPEYSTKMHKAIKNSNLIIVPNVRHMLPIAKSTYVAQHIREFMRS